MTNQITLDFDSSGWTPGMLADHLENQAETRGARWVARQIRNQMKPIEPLVEGAVIRDKDGRSWYRVANGRQVKPTWHSYNQEPRFYGDIDVEAVRREGIK